MSIKKLCLNYLSHGRVDYKGNIEKNLYENFAIGFETTGRRLRELVTEGKIVKVVDGEGHTMYRLSPSLSESKKQIDVVPPSQFTFSTPGQLRQTQNFRNF